MMGRCCLREQLNPLRLVKAFWRQSRKVATSFGFQKSRSRDKRTTPRAAGSPSTGARLPSGANRERTSQVLEPSRRVCKFRASMLMRSPLARERRRPAGFIKPCQPTLSDKAPSGPLWLHEIKHDGYRIIASKSGDRVRLWSRNGRDWSREFTAITEALWGLPDCIIDGEACAQCEEGWPDFWRLRGGGADACFFAFDLLMSNGEDWRRRPLLERKTGLKRLLGRRNPLLRYVEHMEDGGAEMFEHACRLGLEGIVSKRRDARYRSGRSRTWLKIKNPDYERCRIN